MASDADADSLPVCMACGTEFEAAACASNGVPTACKICEDPRQFVPGTGQAWTTLAEVRLKHHNVIKQDVVDPRIWTIETAPRFAIGQRAFLLETPGGCVLWDIIALLDEPTIAFIKSKGPLRAIAVSHPHYWTTHAHWARTFDCPVYLGGGDEEWLCRAPPRPYEWVTGAPGSCVKLLPGTTLIKAGGHFPGSLLLHWDKALFIADTIVTVPSAYSPHPRPPGQTSYVFQWSIPNAIPLPPKQILQIWRAVQPFDVEATHGAFAGMDIRGKDVKKRLLESAQIQARGEGWEGHDGVEIFNETL